MSKLPLLAPGSGHAHGLFEETGHQNDEEGDDDLWDDDDGLLDEGRLPATSSES